MAALEAKLECYEKEVKQFQKALEKSDKYILDLEQKIRDKSANENASLNTKENDQNTLCAPQTSNNDLSDTRNPLSSIDNLNNAKKRTRHSTDPDIVK